MALDFDVIVIGSGFGAAVAAIDQAGKGKTVSSWSGAYGGSRRNCLPRIR